MVGGLRTTNLRRRSGRTLLAATRPKVAAPVFARDALRVTGCPRPQTLVTDIHTACTLVDLKFLPEQARAALLPWLRKPTMELGMQRYKVLDENGEVLGSGQTEEAAIAAAAANMAAGTKQHCADMGITPRAVIENFLANEDYELVAMAS